MADEKTPPVDSAPADEAGASKADSAPAEASPKAAAPKAAPKKEKPPALEDKPFAEFIEQHFIPKLESALKDKGLDDMQITLNQQPLDVFGVNDRESYWHVKGKWQQGAGEASPVGNRQFNIVFTKDDISSPKLFYFADKGSQPSTIEQFMGDERRITLDLLVLFTLGRLNGQKWLARN
ncbi:MAG TPA: DUF2996 domain-containing protein [Nodosilinea sp.]|nr:DUF2996 domain-containing protein [Nodosilinea sp.]